MPGTSWRAARRFTSWRKESIQSLATYYDLIVIHGPDADPNPECQALAGVIDGLVLVAPAAGSPDLARTVELFPEKDFSTIVGV